MLSFLRPREKEKTARAIEKTRSTWFDRVASLFETSHIDDEAWEQLEESLISADVGARPTLDLLDRLKKRVAQENVDAPGEILRLLKEELVSALSVGEGTIDDVSSKGSPLVVLMVGVNGAGKTTSIAKLTKMYSDEGKKVLLAAADTYRAAAIEQLEAWGDRLGVDVISHRHGADPGAVAFDALSAAKARDADILVVDTAGRLHTKHNLMEELRKIQRVLTQQDGDIKQHVILVMDATTGQNGLLQAHAFTKAFRCKGVFLAKLDGTAKGGVVVPIARELELPVLYIGTGEEPDDLARFDPPGFVDALFDSCAND